MYLKFVSRFEVGIVSQRYCFSDVAHILIGLGMLLVNITVHKTHVDARMLYCVVSNSG